MCIDHVCPLPQIVELSLRLIVMWSVPLNLNLYDTYLGLAMIYNQVTVQPPEARNSEIQLIEVTLYWIFRARSVPPPTGSIRCTTQTSGLMSGAREGKLLCMRKDLLCKYDHEQVPIFLLH